MKKLVLLLAPLMALASVAHANITQFQPAGSSAAVCNLPNLPADAQVIAVTAYKGRELAFQIDQSGSLATQLDVAVHADKPVILLLSAYDPTIWNIGWSSGTKIVGVFTSGYHRQAVAGLPKNIPIVSAWTDHKGGAGCSGSYLSAEDMDTAAQTLIHRGVTRIYNKPTPLGYVGIDESKRVKGGLLTSTDHPPSSFRDATAPLAGEAGLNAAVEKGILRKMTPADYAELKTAYVSSQKALKKEKAMPPIAGLSVDDYLARSMPSGIGQGYLVLKEFTIPAGLYGARAVSFVVPKGVPKPTGEIGHCSITYIESFRCEGLCGPH